MDKIASIEDIVSNVAAVRNMGKGFITNFYLNELKHKLWINKGVFFSELVGETYFLIKCNYGFWNVFYTTTSIEALNSDLKTFCANYANATVMIDVVGRNESCEQIALSLSNIGFSEYCKLVRMSRKMPEPKACESECVTFATKADAASVLELLHEFFDERTEQIPYLEELEDLAKSNQMLVLKEDGKFAGYLIFELSKVSIYLRYWFVHPDFRNKGVGSRLLNRFFYEGRLTKRAQHWVICSNDNAIKRYRHFGYEPENMYDYVLTNKNIRYEG